MRLCAGAFCVGSVARWVRLGWWLVLSGPPFTIRVSVHGAAIADPCAPGKPLVRGAATRAKRTTEEDGHGAESGTLDIYARRDRLPRLGAAGHEITHHAAPDLIFGGQPKVSDLARWPQCKPRGDHFAALLGRERTCRYCESKAQRALSPRCRGRCGSRMVDGGHVADSENRWGCGYMNFQLCKIAVSQVSRD